MHHLTIDVNSSSSTKINACNSLSIKRKKGQNMKHLTLLCPVQNMKHEPQNPHSSGFHAIHVATITALPSHEQNGII